MASDAPPQSTSPANPEATVPSRNSPARSNRRQTFSASVSVIARAREELQHLTGYKVDSVSAFERTDDGWKLSVTVVELRRIPVATDVLATYEVILNEAGDVITYHRGNRYLRGQVGQDQ